jgi:hypothetical protein
MQDTSGGVKIGRMSGSVGEWGAGEGTWIVGGVGAASGVDTSAWDSCIGAMCCIAVEWRVVQREDTCAVQQLPLGLYVLLGFAVVWCAVVCCALNISAVLPCAAVSWLCCAAAACPSCQNLLRTFPAKICHAPPSPRRA